MGVMYVVVKRWAPAAKAAESGILRVVARANLTPKHGVALVQVGRRFLVLGVAPSGIGALAEIRDPDEVADLTVRSGSSATSSSRDFNDVLGQSLSGFNPAAAVKSMQATTASSPLTDGVGDLLRRLRNVTARSAENARRGGSVAAANR
jgi:flagellar biogenesis protein FliO